MADYDMLTDGDRVLVAVSGGIDSLVLARVLQLWLQKAPISYEVHAVHVDMQPKGDLPGVVALHVRTVLARFSIPCAILPAAWSPDEAEVARRGKKDVCFKCARSRRTQLFAHARRHRYSLLAMGHHRDDIIETFFLNMLHAGNLSTMAPKQVLFSGRLALIRPLAYLSKEEVARLGRRLSLDSIRSNCPLSEQTARKQVGLIVTSLAEHVPRARENIFAALGNLRPEYLLDPAYRKEHADRS